MATLRSDTRSHLPPGRSDLRGGQPAGPAGEPGAGVATASPGGTLGAAGTWGEGDPRGGITVPEPPVHEPHQGPPKGPTESWAGRGVLGRTGPGANLPSEARPVWTELPCWGRCHRRSPRTQGRPELPGRGLYRGGGKGCAGGEKILEAQQQGLLMV